jgi:flagellar protein FliS
MYRNGIQHYQRARVDTADPKRLVILCYDEMISQLRIARQKCGDGDYEAKSNALLRVQDILCELQCGLDFERGGSIARNLDSLYNYVKKRLIQADIRKDLAAMDEVAGILTELKSAWEQAFRALEKEGFPPESPSRYEEGERAMVAG